MPLTKRASPQAQLQLFCALRFLRISSGHAALNAVYLGLARVRTAGLMALPPLRARIFLSHSCVSNALAADDKACSQQERTNEIAKREARPNSRRHLSA
jgi:hypothetical protein